MLTFVNRLTIAGFCLGRAGLSLGGAAEGPGLEGVIAGDVGLADRSGLAVPATSPRAGAYAAMTSLNDTSAPASTFGRLTWRGPARLQLGLDGALQRLSAAGEFQDWRPMTHQTRVAAENRFLRAQLRKPFGHALSLSSSLAFARGGPTDEERLSIGRDDYMIQRRLSAESWEVATDLTWALDDHDAVTVGADFSRQDHALPTYMQAFTDASPRAGQAQPAGSPGGTVRLSNWGGFLQGTYHPIFPLGVTANLRGDHHSAYGPSLSSRLGLVYMTPEGLVAKALYGSSFKAPSVPQLYGTPLIFGDILGNDALKPERAHMLEGVIAYAPSRAIDLTGSVYYAHVTDKLSFFSRGGNPVAENLGQLDSAGVEAAMKWRWRSLHGLVNTSLQKTVPTLPNGLADPDGVPEPYPGWMLNAGVGGPVGALPIDAFAEARYVGWVASSQTNFVENGHEPYSLPPAFVTDLTFTNADPFMEALKSEAFLANVTHHARLEGAKGTSPFADGAHYARFAQAYQTRFKIPADAYAENAYDAVVLAAFAIQRGGVASREAVREHLREVSEGGLPIPAGAEGLKAGLEALRAGQDVDYDGASGPVDMDARGDVTSGTYAVWEVKDGEIRLTGRTLTP